MTDDPLDEVNRILLDGREEISLANVTQFPVDRPGRKQKAAAVVPPARGVKPTSGTPQAASIEVTEDGVALAFTARHGETLRFDHDAGRWFEWAGDHWRGDSVSRAFSYCRELAREASTDEAKRDLTTARKASFARGVEAFARADPAHAVEQDVWDRDPWLLGAPGVTVDLRTGEDRPPSAADGITRRTAVAPAASELCSLWHRFLEDVTGGDDGLMKFLQQWAGYSLTGVTREHALVFLYGDGGNGKSVFLSTVAGIMGGYAETAGMATFVQSRADRHPTDLAALRGARMVSSSETEEGRSWDTARIKVLTGGDKISARFMRQDFFTYLPEFKLTIVGNHRPALSNVDEAARRRFLIVPFTRKPPEPDAELEAKLRVEWPGILRWMISGALDWQENGLIRPEAVASATADYFAEQDVFGQWLEEDCRVDRGRNPVWETARALFESWTAFARQAGEEPGSQKAFGEALTKRGFRREKKWSAGRTASVWTGIGLKGMEL